MLWRQIRIRFDRLTKKLKLNKKKFLIYISAWIFLLYDRVFAGMPFLGDLEKILDVIAWNS